MPTAEPSNSSRQSVQKRSLNHDAAQPFVNGVASETAVHGFVETNHHIESVLRAPLTVPDFAHTSGHSESTGSAARAQADASVPNPSQATDTQSGNVTPFSTTVNTARLVERLRESEISLRLRSADLGDISIRTAVNHERLSAQISLERNDLSKVIAGEIPALQSKLSQEHGIAATIEVQQQAQSFSGHGGQPQSQPEPTLSPVRTTSERQGQATTVIMTSADVAEGRVDIRV